jgi:NAD(P)-dependent dehydrogenase (short-subunit alcohol dehydrogenase family)
MTSQRRVALVASTAGYVGPDLARSLASRGHDLVIGDPVAGLVGELTGLGAGVEVVEGVQNLATPGSASALVEAALARFGRIDSAVAATGRIVVGRFPSRASRTFAPPSSAASRLPITSCARWSR